MPPRKRSAPAGKWCGDPIPGLTRPRRSSRRPRRMTNSRRAPLRRCSGRPERSTSACRFMASTTSCATCLRASSSDTCSKAVFHTWCETSASQTAIRRRPGISQRTETGRGLRFGDAVSGRGIPPQHFDDQRVHVRAQVPAAICRRRRVEVRPECSAHRRAEHDSVPEGRAHPPLFRRATGGFRNDRHDHGCIARGQDAAPEMMQPGL